MQKDACRHIMEQVQANSIMNLWINVKLEREITWLVEMDFPRKLTLSNLSFDL